MLDGGGTVTLDADRTYVVSQLTVDVAGTTLVIPPTTTVRLLDDATTKSFSVFVRANNVTVNGGGTIIGSSSTRTGVYGLIRAEDADTLLIENLTLHTAPSAAVWVKGGDGVTIQDCTIYNTGADGIHVGRGIANYTIQRNTISGTGDDAIGVIGYAMTGAESHDRPLTGLIDSNDIDDIGTGRGIAVEGCDTVTVSNNNIDGTDQAGVIVSSAEGGYRSESVTVSGNTINDTGRNVPGGGVGDGVYVTNTDTCAVTGNTITNIPFDGIDLVTATSTNLSQSGNTFANITGDDVKTA